MVDLLTGLGAPKQQIIVSLPAFALRFTLKDETKDTPRSPVLGTPERLSQQQVCGAAWLGVAWPGVAQCSALACLRLSDCHIAGSLGSGRWNG